VRVAPTWHPALKAIAPRALITWDNQTDGPVHKIWAKVRSLDANGKVLAVTEEVVVYEGKPVQPGEEHVDGTTGTEGVDPPGRSPRATVKVEVTRYE
jgi:hypothetical protein